MSLFQELKLDKGANLDKGDKGKGDKGAKVETKETKEAKELTIEIH